MNEFEFIKQKLSPLAPADALNNDAFVYRNNTIITKDVIIEGVHFRDNTNPFSIAKKAIRVNLSDVASMGAKPYGYFLGLAMNDTTEWWLNNFVQGLAEENRQFEIKLLGGDTTKHNGKNIISITMLGTIEEGKALTRSGAEIGDSIYVGSTIGDSVLGLLSHSDPLLQKFTSLQKKYELPEPQLELGRKLVGIASACIDISDGLLQDAKQICRLSDVGMEIYADRIPFSEEVKQIIALNQKYFATAITGGDDYRLLFTTSQELAGENFTEIGKVTKDKEIKILDRNGKKLNFFKFGFQHF
ncbi:MAG: thiamine-phosphate kinase [Rickettsiaceae bacterium H1]|nr:thiamine-phosphate kinase [Rickettsiaceae bacterium H1]